MSDLWTQAGPTLAVRIVVVFIVVLGALALVFVTGLVVHHSFTSYQRKRRGAAVRKASIFLAPHLVFPDRLEAATADAEKRFGPWAVGVVLRDARLELKGEESDKISRVLTTMGEVDRLKRELGASQDWRRVRALRQLVACGGDSARDAMLLAVKDPVAGVRRAAREGLLVEGSPASLNAAIQSYLQDAASGAAYRRSFYARLAQVSPEDLRGLLDSGRLAAAEEKLALEALGDARVASAIPLARQRLSSADREIRAAAVRVLGKLEDRESLPAFTRLLSDPEWFVKAVAARAFVSLPADGQALSALGRCLYDEAWWVRSNAAHALSRQGEPGVEILLEAVESQDKYARDACLEALGVVVFEAKARRRLELVLSRLPEDAATAPLRELLGAIARDQAS